ncbi:CsgG/HfaB family protein [Maridesulfovibrio salexigens]|uniref:Curli production assembly/transport component CsgG n=1 Tax=Maridesulfovibrio salexigens (strain ATCC 14822 / DSM 2638 / NCIMB 8403 / VKM B-1763) TaxID=526222 RepID=C6BWK5_MARSD|nr:CsgG/HfaB family protein [Maridesulfovibrio salexigens]ACS80285.1 hypothetical protein Desal_2229 [Maridesulfovibrio salexigens DSM 2638]
MKKYLRFVQIVLVLAAVSVLGLGCIPRQPRAPAYPIPPKSIYETIQEAVVTPMNLDSFRMHKRPLTKEKTFAIMNFRANDNTSGSMVSDRLIIELKTKGYHVIDREEIDKVVREQAMMSEHKTGLTDLEIAQRIGRLVHADYFVFGSVTDKYTDSLNISLNRIIVKNDIPRYDRDVEMFESERSEYEMESDKFASRTGIMLPELERAKTIDEWQEDYYAKPKRTFSTISRIGLTAKVVDVKTSQIFWVGQAGVSDTGMQDGLKRVVRAMISSILTGD